MKNGPFDLDLVFAPDGIERFEDAWARRVDVEGFPVCHPDDIIASQLAANRVKDRESLPGLAGLSFGGQVFLAALNAGAMDVKTRKAPA